MLDIILKPFTTASASGVGVRYLLSQVGAVLAILGVFGLLSEAQQKVILDNVETLGPTIILLWGFAQWAVPTLYAMITKSSSDKAAGVAKTVDADVPAADPVVIQTPTGQNNIVVDRDGRKVSA